MNRIFLTRLQQQHVIPFPFTPNCCQPIRNSPPPLRIAGKASEMDWAVFAAKLEKEREGELPNFIKSAPTLLVFVGLGMDNKAWENLTIQDIVQKVRAAQAAGGELRPPFIRPLLLLSSSPPPLKLRTLNICSPFCSSTTGKIGGSLSIPFRVILPVLCATIVVVSLMNHIFLTRLQIHVIPFPPIHLPSQARPTRVTTWALCHGYFALCLVNALETAGELSLPI